MSLHPILVHFPIALLVTGVGFDLAGLLLKRDHLRTPARYMLATGLVAAVASWLTGPIAAEQAEPFLPREGGIYTHRNYATLAIILFATLLALRSRLSGGRSPAGYVGLAALSLLVLFMAGRTGGEMVYGERGMIATMAGDRFQQRMGGEQGEGLFNEGFERTERGRGGGGGDGTVAPDGGIDQGAPSGSEAGERGGFGGREAGEAGEAGERGGR